MINEAQIGDERSLDGKPLAKYGLASLTEREKAILDWDSNTELAAFFDANKDKYSSIQEVEQKLGRKIFFFHAHVIDKEIPGVIALNPKLSRGKIISMLMGSDPSDSHFGRHGMNEFEFPKSYLEAWVEYCRESFMDQISAEDDPAKADQELAI